MTRQCDIKSAATDRKKECKIIFISKLFTFYQQNPNIHTVGLNNILNLNFSGGTSIIFKYLNFETIIDMYDTYTHEGNSFSMLFDSYPQLFDICEHDKMSVTRVI